MELEVSLPCSKQPATCTYPESDQFTSSKFLPLGSILKSFSHIRIYLTGGLIPLCFPTKPLCSILFSPIPLTRPTHPHPPWCIYPNDIWRGVQIIVCHSLQFFQFPTLNASSLGSDIFLAMHCVYNYLSSLNQSLTLRRLMSYIYIYGAPILDVSRSHTTTQHSR